MKPGIVYQAALWVGVAAVAVIAWRLVIGPAPVDSRPDTGEGHPDILLVTFDTLRTDHVSSNGYPKRTTPFIDSLAKQGIRFSRAYSSSSWTVPALASLMTSTYAERHGMDVNRRVNRQAGVIPKELPMLAELLGEAGYESFGITANFGLLQLQGFDRGFDRFVSPGAVGAEEVEGLLTTWLGEIGEASPWFVWLHIFDPHAPYLAREDWLGEFWDAPRINELEGARVRAQPSYDQRQMDFTRALYDSEIRYADALVERMYRALPRAERALVVVSADHGEEFFERGSIGHGRTLFEEVVRVPLIVRLPDRAHAGAVVDEVASLVDVAPTIFEVIGLQPPQTMAGSSLLGPEGPRREQRTLFAKVTSINNLRSAIEGRFKLIQTVDGSQEWLYDLRSDPGEKIDIREQQPAVAARLRKILARHVANNREGRVEPRTAPITREQEAALRALGYTE